MVFHFKWKSREIQFDIKDGIVCCLKSNWRNSVLAYDSILIQNRVAQNWNYYEGLLHYDDYIN